MSRHSLLDISVQRAQTGEGLVREVDAALRSAGRARSTVLHEPLRELGDAGVLALHSWTAGREGGRDGGEGEGEGEGCDYHEFLHGPNHLPAT